MNQELPSILIMAEGRFIKADKSHMFREFVVGQKTFGCLVSYLGWQMGWEIVSTRADSRERDGADVVFCGQLE